MSQKFDHSIKGKELKVLNKSSKIALVEMLKNLNEAISKKKCQLLSHHVRIDVIAVRKSIVEHLGISFGVGLRLGIGNMLE